MEIACLVTVKKPATLQSTKLAEKYFKLVKEKYVEPKNEEILGHFVRNIGTGATQKTVGKESRNRLLLLSPSKKCEDGTKKRRDKHFWIFFFFCVHELSRIGKPNFF